MTTSVIGSARASTASLFDTVTQTLGLVTDVVTSASLGMDMLHHKVKQAHATVTQNAEVSLKIAKKQSFMDIIKDHSIWTLDMAKEIDKTPGLRETYESLLANFTVEEE